MTKINRTFRLDKELSRALDKICVRHGDITWHLEGALRAYIPTMQADNVTIPSFLKPKPEPSEAAARFDVIWDFYERKGNRKTSRSRYMKLSQTKRDAIDAHLPAYIQSTPDKKYRKGFEVYINLECWNDEVIPHEDNNRSNQGGRPSVVARVHAAANEREQARRVEERALDGQAMGETSGGLRSPAQQPIRGDDTPELGRVIDGDYSRAD